MATTITSKGQVTIPKRTEDPGCRVGDIKRLGGSNPPREVTTRPAPSPAKDLN
jgi:hypothetical protein